MNKFYTTEEVAEILQLKTPITVRRWIMKRKISAVKLGKEYRISKTDLQEFIERRKIEAEEK